MITIYVWQACDTSYTLFSVALGICHSKPRESGASFVYGAKMVETLDKAKRIQARRSRAGKSGIAAAVRRFLKRENRPYTDLK